MTQRLLKFKLFHLQDVSFWISHTNSPVSLPPTLRCSPHYAGLPCGTKPTLILQKALLLVHPLGHAFFMVPLVTTTSLNLGKAFKNLWLGQTKPDEHSTKNLANAFQECKDQGRQGEIEKISELNGC